MCVFRIKVQSTSKSQFVFGANANLHAIISLVNSYGALCMIKNTLTCLSVCLSVWAIILNKLT